MSFCDLPGFSESAAADLAYLQIYLEQFRSADAALYTVASGTRALEYERIVLSRLMDNAETEKERAEILQKLVLVMTKADTVAVDGPWTLTVTPDRKVVALPDKSTRQVLEAQARYAWRELFEPFAAHLVTRVRSPGLSGHFEEGSLSVTDGLVEYRGILDPETVTEHARRHPRLQPALQKLYDRQRAVVCSARFSYGLDELLLRVFENASQGAIYRLSGLSATGLRSMQPGRANGLANVRLADPFRKRLVELSFDWLEDNNQSIWKGNNHGHESR
jgi:hypothetical protein